MFRRNSVAQATPRPHSDTSVDRAYADLGLDVIRMQLDATDLVSDRVGDAAQYARASARGVVATEVAIDSEPKPAVVVEVEVPAAEQTLEIFARHAKGKNQPTDSRKPLAREIIDRVLRESWAEENDPGIPAHRQSYTIKQYNALHKRDASRPDYNQGSLSVEEAISRVGLQDTFNEVRRGLRHWDLERIAEAPVFEQAATINGFVAGLQESLNPNPNPEQKITTVNSFLLPTICSNCGPDLRQDLLPIEL